MVSNCNGGSGGCGILSLSSSSSSSLSLIFHGGGLIACYYSAWDYTANSAD